jgi:uncharacterized membrane protein (UPF0127 family)
MSMPRGLLLVAAILVAAACSPVLPGPLDGLPVVSVTAGGTELRLALAVDKARGLSGIDHLGDLDGMLFDYGREVAPAAHPFWMAGVRFPLELAFYDGDGRLVDRVVLDACPDGGACPTHVAVGPFRWVVEALPGSIGAGTRLQVADAPTSFVPSPER